jgi:hypothetical protein
VKGEDLRPAADHSVFSCGEASFDHSSKGLQVGNQSGCAHRPRLNISEKANIQSHFDNNWLIPNACNCSRVCSVADINTCFSFRSFRPARGESWEDVQARADRFLRWLVDTHIKPAPPVEKQFSKLPNRGPPPESLLSDGAGASLADGTENVPTSLSDGTETKPTPVAISTSTDMGDTLETGLSKRMLRSGSFYRDKGQDVEEGPRRGVPRSGSFTGDPRTASQVLGIPRSASFAEDLVPRVTGVKRAGSFNVLAPKVMKRVDSLGLSKLFDDELRVEGVGAQDGAAKRGDTGRDRSSGSESDCAGDEGLGGGGTRGGKKNGVDVEGRGEGEADAVKGLASGPELFDEEMQVDTTELGNVIGRDESGGRKGQKRGPHNSVGLDSDEGMHVHQLVGGVRKEKWSADGLEERSNGVAQKAQSEDGKPSANGGIGGRGKAICTGAERGEGQSSEGGSRVLLARFEDGNVYRPIGTSDGCAECGSTGVEGQLSREGAATQERPKARRKGGRPPVIRILAVTHGAHL